LISGKNSRNPGNHKPPVPPRTGEPAGPPTFPFSPENPGLIVSVENGFAPNASGKERLMKRAAVWIALLAWTIASPALAEEPAPVPPPAAGLSPFSLGAHLSYWNAKDLDEVDLDGMLGGGVIGRFRLHD
jgi:hypothetical protein